MVWYEEWQEDHDPEDPTDTPFRYLMKLLHRSNLFSWSPLTKANVDFNGTLWVREGGNIVIDPMPMSDRAHLAELGGAAWIIMTNSDRTRWGQSWPLKRGETGGTGGGTGCLAL